MGRAKGVPTVEIGKKKRFSRRRENFKTGEGETQKKNKKSLAGSKRLAYETNPSPSEGSEGSNCRIPG